MCGYEVFSNYCYHTNHTTSDALGLLNHHLYDDKASGNLSHLRSNAAIITGFHHEHFSVLLGKARKIHTDILESMLDIVLDRRGTPTNVLLHSYLQDVRSYSFAASALLMLLHVNFSCFTGEWITSVAVTNLQSLTKGLWPGLYAEETLRRPTPKTSPVCQNCQLRIIICCW
ncbi:uncharacterized protein LOC124204058 [Daphnia pulex]|uniref:uncharacterized protein LOC124204058 n=1 Tax=Daphnia pulex TaxID=6669 RepID=UPI001EE114C0|nr:uncharacterized protein LOC124204058 [Daphnia pulex]